MTTAPEPPDHQLVAAALAGDDDAFGALLRRYQDYIFHLCWRVLGSRAEAEDAAQDSFVTLHGHLHRIDPGRKLGNWLYTVALNHCRKRLRRRRLAAFFSLDASAPDGRPLLPEPRDPRPDPASLSDSARQREALDRAVQGLPGDLREAFVLRYELDLDLDEIAAALGRSNGATRVLLHRARLRLRQLCLEQGLTPPPSGDRDA